MMGESLVSSRKPMDITVRFGRTLIGRMPSFSAHYHDLTLDTPEVNYNFGFLGFFR
jgi:hypothetical protein